MNGLAETSCVVSSINQIVLFVKLYGYDRCGQK